MKKLLISSVVAGMLVTSASAWDFCSDYSKLLTMGGTTGAAIAIGTTTVAVPGLIVGAILNQVVCDGTDEVKTFAQTEDQISKKLDIKDIRNIHFDFDQYKLDEDAQEDVQFDSDIIQTLAAPIIIEGNADSRGSDEYNYALGLKRAEEVKQALIIDGVKNELKVISYGESAPICTETTEDCLAKNRRVQFKTETK